MSLLGKYTDNFIEDEELEGNSGYTPPSVLKNDEEISLKKSIIISAILHPTVAGVSWLIVFILALMGITFTIFDKPKPKVNDIEFVLVDKEETPINKNTPYRADINSRAGGHHDPTRKVSMPSPAPGAPKAASQPAKKAAAPAQNPLQKIVKQVTQQVDTQQVLLAAQETLLKAEEEEGVLLHQAKAHMLRLLHSLRQEVPEQNLPKAAGEEQAESEIRDQVILTDARVLMQSENLISDLI